jgi:serine/threonine protein kinase
LEEELNVGQYILTSRIGAGGMAEVWEARHVHLGHRVAVKFLLPEFARNQELQERFLNEGKRQAQLQHPNIVPAVDFFQVNGRSYLVMQYVDGHDLDARLEDGNPPLSLDEIHGISWDVLSALDHAHSLGVIHRDVKPANMLIDHNGRTMLMDFGIAKALHDERSATLTTTAMGTPDYMSPEQIVSPKKVDARSDIYSFGCVLYAMLTGHPPFGSGEDTAFHVQDCHVRATPAPPVSANPDIPKAVGGVVLRCLEKDPARRYQTCGAVMSALDSAISTKPTVVDNSQLSAHLAPAPVRPSPTKVETQTILENFEAAKKTGAPVKELEAVIPKPNPARPDSSSSRGSSKYVIVAVVLVIAIAGAAVAFFALHPKDDRRHQLETKDWSRVNYDDPDLADCLGVDSCITKKTQVTKLTALSAEDWKNLHYDNSLLENCMGYPACIQRKAQADKLRTTTDWLHADKALLADCMYLPSCLQRTKSPLPEPHAPRGTPGDTEDTPDCCDNAANPAQCRKLKKEQSIQDNCHPLMGSN